MNSERYHEQFEQLPPEFTSDELIHRYQAGLPMTPRDRRDAERILMLTFDITAIC